jgi:N-acetylglucosaminyldiphosphoundecaprenol N-acetyl-beta-D-mannosaminyltransferase
LWFCIWGTYNTDIFGIFSPKFPNGIFDLVHGARSLLPGVAFIFSAVFLFKNKDYFKSIFYSPVGLLIVFSLLGIISGIFSNKPVTAMYWGVLYGGVLFFLLVYIKNKDILRKIIILNFIIAGVIALGLTFFFFLHPGAISSITYNFLICGQRPYEGIAGLYANSGILGMVGSRPTGLGRYAGLVAIACLASFCFVVKKSKLKLSWFLLFVIFLGILLFSKGKTEMLAFILSIMFLLYFVKKINILSVLGTLIIIAISTMVIFYNIPCTNTPIFINKIQSMFNDPKTESIPIIQNNSPIIEIPPTTTEKIVESLPLKIEQEKVIEEIKPVPEIPEIVARKNVVTLSGRTGGVWTDAWNLFLTNPLFGYGFQADRYFLNGQHAHNTIIHALIQAGILGTLAMFLAFVLLLVYLVKLFRNKFIQLKEKQFLITITAVLVFFAVRGLTESLAFFSADWLFVAPIIAYIQCLNNELKSNKKNESGILEFRGSKINIMKMSEVLEKMSGWIKNERNKFHWIIVTGMHGISEANKNEKFKKKLSFADLFVPDGISLVWLAKLKGFEAKERISGADLMKEFFKLSEKNNFSNYFYGDTNETLNLLNKKVKKDFPNLKIVGTYSPPFRELSETEENKIIERINNSNADVLWVALGLPKQEKWIYKNREKLKVPVVVGVGAAFKFLSGKVKRAPVWVGSLGLEWLWRLITEPKTTWKRVFIDMPFFMWLVLLDLVGSKRYK